MISYPKPGDRVQVWYRMSLRLIMPLHGLVGRVAVVGRGKPRNHGVEIGRLRHFYVVPCGNLRCVPDRLNRVIDSLGEPPP